MNKKGQEEMVGFVLIVIVVAVILLFFLTISLQSKDTSIESHEVDSFIVSFLEYTTDCKSNSTAIYYADIEETIFNCIDDEVCVNDCIEDEEDPRYDEECVERLVCEVLDTELDRILDASWPVSPESSNKGYELKILSNDQEIHYFSEGQITSKYKGSLQNFARDQSSIDITFRVYT